MIDGSRHARLDHARGAVRLVRRGRARARAGRDEHREERDLRVRAARLPQLDEVVRGGALGAVRSRRVSHLPGPSAVGRTAAVRDARSARGTCFEFLCTTHASVLNRDKQAGAPCAQNALGRASLREKKPRRFEMKLSSPPSVAPSEGI